MWNLQEEDAHGNIQRPAINWSSTELMGIEDGTRAVNACDNFSQKLAWLPGHGYPKQFWKFFLKDLSPRFSKLEI